MTRYFLRLPGHATVDAALEHAAVIGRPVMDRGPDGFVRGSCEVVANSSQARAVKAVCDYYRINLHRLLDVSRTEHLADARAVAQWLIRRWAGLSWRETANAVGRKDHTTAIAAVAKVDERTDLYMAALAICGWLDGKRGAERRAA